MRTITRCVLVAICAMGACAAAESRDALSDLPPSSASPSHAQRVQERDQIKRERQALEQLRVHKEAGCYQRFAVEDCLGQVRAALRKQDNALQQRELQLDTAERKEKASQRRRVLAEQQANQQEPRQPGKQPPAVHGQLRSQVQSRQEQAQARAAQQAQRQAEHAQQQRQRNQQEKNNSAQARAHYEAKQRQAAERRARLARQQAEAMRNGHKPSQPLPSKDEGHR